MCPASTVAARQYLGFLVFIAFNHLFSNDLVSEYALQYMFVLPTTNWCMCCYTGVMNVMWGFSCPKCPESTVN